MQKIYLDYAATTPVDPEVMKAMKPYFSYKLGLSDIIIVNDLERK